MTVEHSDYQRWVLRHTVPRDDLYRQRFAVHRLPRRPRISIVTPVYNTPPMVLRRMLYSIQNQTYPDWELCLVDDGSTDDWIAPYLERLAAREPRIRFHRRDTNGGIVAASNDALDLATGEFLAFVDHDDEIEPDALFAVARTIGEQPDVDVLYSDFDYLTEDGLRRWPGFWPEWSPERLQALPYIVHLRVFRRSCVEAVGRFRPGFDGAQDFDMILRLSEHTDRIAHIPELLYHWRSGGSSAAESGGMQPQYLDAGARALTEHLQRIGLAATRKPARVAGMHVLAFSDAPRRPVSIIVVLDAPTLDASPEEEDVGASRAALCACLSSLAAHAGDTQIEVVLVARGTVDWMGEIASSPRNVGGLDAIVSVRVVEAPAGTPTEAALNLGAREADGDLLVFCDTVLEVLSDDWLRSLAGYAGQEAIGAAGARVLSVTGAVHHAGMVILRRTPLPVLRGAAGDDVGPYGVLVTASNYSAVSSTGLATRRAVFDALGGFRPGEEVGFPDVDYCLRLRESGYRVVFAPLAECRLLAPVAEAAPDERERRLAAFQRTWADWPDIDPYYSRHFEQTNGDYRVAVN